jgi:malonyl-CoA/methylmalonyl-CoA synthetase
MTPRGTPTIPLIQSATGFLDRNAIRDASGDRSYSELLDDSARGAARLLNRSPDLREARVAFMIDPTYDYVRAQWSIWRAGGIAVPLCVTHPARELEYVLDTVRPVALVTSPKFSELTGPLARARGIELLDVKELDASPVELLAVAPQRGAMILFTSGTTGRPKGVVITHANIAAQIRSLIEAWEWSQEDRILLTLPLHHIHGIVNVLGCSLWSGASCEMLASFDPEAVIGRLSSGTLTLYMAVPTIYHRLISYLDKASDATRQEFKKGCAQMRLMVSGSAALPIPVLERWRELSGHTLLERFGMTEIGMGLSNPLRGERVPGEVGRPLPGVQARLVDDDGGALPEGTPGEIQIRGETVFTEYWERPDETTAAFTDDGWFRTGDTAVVEDGRYRILGRTSVDILKSGGEKISALEIEEVLLGHEAVAEAAVVGVDDEEWGQRVVAVVVARAPVESGELKEWSRAHLAPHKIPKAFLFTDSIPRNPMGKTIKPDVVTWVLDQG